MSLVCTPWGNSGVHRAAIAVTDSAVYENAGTAMGWCRTKAQGGADMAVVLSVMSLYCLYHYLSLALFAYLGEDRGKF